MRAIINPIILSSTRSSTTTSSLVTTCTRRRGSVFLRQQQQQQRFFFFFRWRWLIVAATTTTRTAVSSFTNSHHQWLIRFKRPQYYYSATASTQPTSLAAVTATTADSAATEPPSSSSSSSSSAASNSNCQHRSPFTMTTTTTTTTTTALQSPPSFYRRPLPASCTAFSSKRGRLYLSQAMQQNGLKSFFHLMEQYTTQSEPAYCGISTLVISLNALQVDPRREWKKPWRWYQEEMLNCCVNLDQVKMTGITMADFACLAICQGLQAHVHHAEPVVAVAQVATVSATAAANTNTNTTTPSTTTTTSSKPCNQCNTAPSASPYYSSLEHFRSSIAQACMEKDHHHHDHHHPENDDNNDSSNPPLPEQEQSVFLQDILIVSYNRAVLQQSGSGHFSPIAAYDPISDTVLILDTARFKYGAHWVAVDLLYAAMQSLDPATNKSRGYILLHVNRDDDDKQQLHHHHERLLSHIAKTKATTDSSASRPVDVVTEFKSPSTITGTPTISRQSSSSFSSSLSQSPSPKQAHPDDLSILVRFKLTLESKRARREFQSKFFSSSLQQQQEQQPGFTTASWPDVYQFWMTRPECSNSISSNTACSTTPTTFIWDLMEPALTPLQKSTKQLVNDVLSLICHVMKTTNDETQQPVVPNNNQDCGGNNTNDIMTLSKSISVSSSSSYCRPNFSRTLALQPMQAIWLVYFCLLEESRRQELLSLVPASSFIFTTTPSSSNGNDHDKGDTAKEEDDEMTSRARAAREQLLATAETLRLFLEMQDE
jgi:Phytochelatin synthase